MKKDNHPEAMPNAISGKNYQFDTLGNNGQGFNLYKSHVDGMIVAKPQQANTDNMPVKGFNNPKSYIIKPDSLNKRKN